MCESFLLVLFILKLFSLINFVEQSGKQLVSSYGNKKKKRNQKESTTFGTRSQRHKNKKKTKYFLD